MKPNIEEAVIHLINGLTTDGAHHKQWDMEQALIALKGKEWVNTNRWVDENGDVVEQFTRDQEVYERWEEGIPA